jgi:hypothetical protein
MHRNLKTLAALLAVGLLAVTMPHHAVAKDNGLHSSDFSAKKKYKTRKQPHVYVAPPARRAWGYRSDPSFDPYGRPWRPNFYAPCYEDLGYGRFRDCSDIR